MLLPFGVGATLPAIGLEQLRPGGAGLESVARPLGLEGRGAAGSQRHRLIVLEGRPGVALRWPNRDRHGQLFTCSHLALRLGGEHLEQPGRGVGQGAGDVLGPVVSVYSHHRRRCHHVATGPSHVYAIAQAPARIVADLEPLGIGEVEVPAIRGRHHLRRGGQGAVLGLTGGQRCIAGVLALHVYIHHEHARGGAGCDGYAMPHVPATLAPPCGHGVGVGGGALGPLGQRCGFSAWLHWQHAPPAGDVVQGGLELGGVGQALGRASFGVLFAAGGVRGGGHRATSSVHPPQR